MAERGVVLLPELKMQSSSSSSSGIVEELEAIVEVESERVGEYGGSGGGGPLTGAVNIGMDDGGDCDDCDSDPSPEDEADSLRCRLRFFVTRGCSSPSSSASCGCGSAHVRRVVAGRTSSSSTATISHDTTCLVHGVPAYFVSGQCRAASHHVASECTWTAYSYTRQDACDFRCGPPATHVASSGYSLWRLRCRARRCWTTRRRRAQCRVLATLLLDARPCFSVRGCPLVACVRWTQCKQRASRLVVVRSSSGGWRGRHISSTSPSPPTTRASSWLSSSTTALIPQCGWSWLPAAGSHSTWWSTTASSGSRRGVCYLSPVSAVWGLT